MQRLVRIFRGLIVASVGLGLLAGAIDLIIPSLLPDVLNDAWETYLSEEPAWFFIAMEEQSWRFAIAGALALVAAILAIASMIGLLMLKRWARPVALWTTAASLLSYPLFGATVYSSWSQMLMESAMILWGAVLAMAYFSELRTRFES